MAAAEPARAFHLGMNATQNPFSVDIDATWPEQFLAHSAAAIAAASSRRYQRQNWLTWSVLRIF
jgi:hypothetical protein